ncbi:MAG TPA: rRNA adenine N(6)-methyltransferase family protein, partial [Ktedonobacterales bacterium]|nr:rRNA adenine N(6)-methyltransferase family protein [Ktedonobacterales bacterium]
MSSLLNLRVQLSQNFLRDSHLVATLLDRFDLGSDSHVYEIGAGEGIITEQLAQRYKRVIGIEKDERLADRLRRRFSNYPHVTILSGDFLRMPLPHGPYKVFANIPFNITSAIVARLIGEGRPPEEAYLTMQKEAAEMYLGKPHETLRTVLM